MMKICGSSNASSSIGAGPGRHQRRRTGCRGPLQHLTGHAHRPGQRRVPPRPIAVPRRHRHRTRSGTGPSPHPTGRSPPPTPSLEPCPGRHCSSPVIANEPAVSRSNSRSPPSGRRPSVTNDGVTNWGTVGAVTVAESVDPRDAAVDRRPALRRDARPGQRTGSRCGPRRAAPPAPAAGRPARGRTASPCATTPATSTVSTGRRAPTAHTRYQQPPAAATSAAPRAPTGPTAANATDEPST